MGKKGKTILDQVGSRSGKDRRRNSTQSRDPDRRSGRSRRSGFDRRNGSGKRKDIDRRDCFRENISEKNDGD